MIYPFEKVLLEEMTDFAPHEFIGVSLRDLRRLPFTRVAEYRDRLVVLQPVTFRNKRDFNAHRLLRAIDNNVLLSRLPESEQACPEEQMYPLENLVTAFSGMEFILENTERLMQQCQIHFDFSENRKPQNLRTYTGRQEADEQLLERLCREGMPYRYPAPGPEVYSRLEKELQLIKQKGFVSYFLINWDIVSEARRRGFFYVGRGSGANSIVAYLLRITDVDPIELDLYFERFINLFRANPPDFDIDFSWKDREAVTRYIFGRFKHVSLLGTYVTFRQRGIIRELGKVFGLPKAEIDQLCEGRYTSSRLDEVARLADHLVLLDGGRIVAAGPLQDTLASLDLPLAQAEDASAVLHGHVAALDETWGLADINVGEVRLQVPASGLRPEQAVRLRIAARDVVPLEACPRHRRSTVPTAAAPCRPAPRAACAALSAARR